MARLADVIQLPRKGQPDDDVVKILEGLLEEARKGAIVGFAGAVHYGGPVYGYMGTGSLVANPELGLAAATRLKFKFI